MHAQRDARGLPAPRASAAAPRSGPCSGVRSGEGRSPLQSPRAKCLGEHPLRWPSRRLGWGWGGGPQQESHPVASQQLSGCALPGPGNPRARCLLPPGSICHPQSPLAACPCSASSGSGSVYHRAILAGPRAVKELPSEAFGVPAPRGSVHPSSQSPSAAASPWGPAGFW